MAIQFLIDGHGFGLGVHRAMRWTESVLRFFDGLECSRRQEREDGGTQAGDVAGGDQHRFVEDVGIYAIENVIALRNSTAVDNAPHRSAMFFHPVQNDARVEGGAFDRGE